MLLNDPWASLLGLICYGPLPLDVSQPKPRVTSDRPNVLLTTVVCDIPTALARLNGPKGALDA